MKRAIGLSEEERHKNFAKENLKERDKIKFDT